ncbi:major facilitator superfamily domain-containing protein [Microdochium trichocladiopsis]|uniref:Major facilitator superfamily domain-containing protein n=1 Tax=Microdochium trichocladiopsis TaxID=1682393 RepID=A0A9P8YB21_9PEZI|nr:major facilitator superfamily domain-containing protein [Microdochium trichocladiopsis]KAH7035213.1 major facilitator superfamily domain-containing protein [Microdochium trichocladiopsis]
MSLPRVGSLETFLGIPGGANRGDGDSRRGSVSSIGSASLRARKITFNPLPESWDPGYRSFGDEGLDGPGAPQLSQQQHHHQQPQSVGAFEVPQWRRILQVIVTVINCLLAAGIVFGYAAIKPVLKKEGAYRDVCDGDDTCVELHLNFMFTVAAVATNIAALPIGAILDHYGPRVCGLLGACFLAVGALMLAFAADLPFDGFLSGYLFLALGGPFTYIASYHLSNAFPRRSGLILALLTGAFDASSALFLVYRLVYESTGDSLGHHEFFLAYLVVPVLIIVTQLTILPKQSYKTVGEMVDDIHAGPIGGGGAALYDPDNEDAIVDDQVDEQTALLREEQRQSDLEHQAAIAGIDELLGNEPGKNLVDEQISREEAKNERSGVWGAMHAATAWEQLCSPWFVLVCLFTVVQMTRINYFVATIRGQYEALLGSPEGAVEMNNFFDLALPLGGIISIPFIGGILDGTSTVAVLATLVAVATSIGALGVLPYTWAGYANIVLFVLYRPFYYTAVSDYCAKVFGFRTFGTVYGTIICLAGVLNFSQSLLDYMFRVTFGGNPVPVNLILLVTGLVIGLLLVAYVWVQARLLRGKKMVHVTA